VGRERHYIGGSHYKTCDRCGGVYRHTKMRQEWTGLWVCSGGGTRDCWEQRHPQDFVRGIKEDISVKDARPLATWTGTAHCTVTGRSAIAGYAIGGCSITARESINV